MVKTPVSRKIAQGRLAKGGKTGQKAAVFPCARAAFWLCNEALRRLFSELAKQNTAFDERYIERKE